MTDLFESLLHFLLIFYPLEKARMIDYVKTDRKLIGLTWI